MDDKELRNIIAENLIANRKKMGWTQAQLAAELNYSDKSISKWERGDGVPDVIVLKNLADRYGIRVDDFFTPYVESEEIPEEIPEEESAKPPRSLRARVLVPMLSIGLAWLAATILFFFFMVIAPSFTKGGLFFMWTVPISFIISTVFVCIWWGQIARFVSISGIYWTTALSIFVTFWGSKYMSLIFAVAGVLQILTILWFILKRPAQNKD